MEVKVDWRKYVGCYIKVAQEVELDNVWTEIELEGWVAQVMEEKLLGGSRPPDGCEVRSKVAEVVNAVDVTLVMDNGEQWTVEDSGVSVRNSHFISCIPQGMPNWKRVPSKWVQSETGWVRAPVASKVVDCDCSRCSLYENQLVDDKGRLEKCDVLFCGEAPGFEEARSQPPSFFIGKAGRLLKAIIEQTALKDYKCRFNNTCICYSSEAPTTDDMRACKKRLLREIWLAHPKLIVAVGGVALEALTGLTGITEHQGTLMDWTMEGPEGESEKIKLLACFHSAAVLRRPDLFYTFAETVNKAGLYITGDRNLDVPLEAFTCMTVIEEMWTDAIKELNTAEKLYVDLETTDYNPYTSDIICVSISYRLEGKASRRSFVFPWELIRQHFGEFQYLLETKPSGYWNGFFDAQFLRQHGIKVNLVDDVMLKQYTQDETPLAQSLKGGARRYCNAPDWEAPLKPYLPSRSTSFGVIPHDVLFLYAGYDAGYTGVLDDVISARMVENNWRVYNEILIPALKMFLDTCEIGMRVDTSRLEELRAELQTKMTELQRKLANMIREGAQQQLVVAESELNKMVLLGQGGGEREVALRAKIEVLQARVVGADSFNPSSINDARYLIYDIVGIPTNSATSSTSRTALEDYKDVEGVSLLLRFRETRKLLGTYIEGLVDDLIEEEREEEVIGENGIAEVKKVSDAVVHPNIRLNGTVTGRLSSNNPNFFGIPDEKGGIKKLYKARYDGWGVGDGDGAQMEVRVLGSLANDIAMIEAFRAGVDFHGAARNRLYGRGFSKGNYSHQEVLDAKTAVFGPIYGRGPESLAQQFYHSEIAMLREADKTIRWPTWESLPRQEQQNRILKAQEHIDKLWEPYPISLAWLKANVAKAQEDGELQSYYGRVRHWGLITEATLEDIKTAGRNFPVQSASSDTNLQIMIGSYHTFSSNYYIPIFPVHDAVVFMYKLGTENWLIPQLREYYEKRARDLLHTSMPLEYEFTIGPNWGEQTEWKEAK